MVGRTGAGAEKSNLSTTSGEASLYSKTGWKTAALGVPAIRDRTAETAAGLILEPIFEADLQAATQFAAGRFAANSSLESRAQDVKFCLRHDAFQAENQAIVEKRRMIDAVAVSHQSIGHAAQIEQAIPVGIVACQAGDFQSEHDSRAAHSHLRGQVCEAGALDPPRTRPAQIFIDDDHLFFGPAQLADFFHQIILASGGLAVVFNLRGAGLTNIDVGCALDMVGFYFARIIHGSSPPPDCVEPFGR